MLNNKGFAVSTVLYTLLIAFLLFLGGALAQFSSSNSLISNVNNDLINGTKFEAVQVKTKDACENGKQWYNSNIIVKVRSRYGTFYWPKDFEGSKVDNGNINIENGANSNGKIKVEKKQGTDNTLTFTDTGVEPTNSIDVTIGDICK